VCTKSCKPCPKKCRKLTPKLINFIKGSNTTWFFWYWECFNSFIFMGVRALFVQTKCAMFGTLTEIVRKSWEKDRKFSPIFSKWECFCQNWRIIRQFWQKGSHFERVGEGFLSFSSNFPMIFVSECDLVWCVYVLKLSLMSIFKSVSCVTNSWHFFYFSIFCCTFETSYIYYRVTQKRPIYTEI